MPSPRAPTSLLSGGSRGGGRGPGRGDRPVSRPLAHPGLWGAGPAGSQSAGCQGPFPLQRRRGPDVFVTVGSRRSPSAWDTDPVVGAARVPPWGAHAGHRKEGRGTAGVTSRGPAKVLFVPPAGAPPGLQGQGTEVGEGWGCVSSRPSPSRSHGVGGIEDGEVAVLRRERRQKVPAAGERRERQLQRTGAGVGCLTPPILHRASPRPRSLKQR